MRVEIRFVSDQDDGDASTLSGKTVVAEHAKIMRLNTRIDTFPDGNGGMLPGDTGEICLITYGPIPIWSET